MRTFNCGLLLAYICGTVAFNTLRSPSIKATHVYSTPEGGSTEVEDGNMLKGFKVGFNIFKKGMNSNDGFKQSLADALAGPDLDLKIANDRIDAYLKTSPIVVFSWSQSPFSKKAKKLLQSIGAKYESVELDQPWSDGNPIRSALGRRVGRTSVPAIFVNGQYVGGCEDGPTQDAPGLVPLAFQGKLRPLLIAAGAIQADETVDFSSTHVKKQIIEAATVETASSISIKQSYDTATPSVQASSETYVSSTVTANQAKAMASPVPVAVIVEKKSTPARDMDTSVSTVVTANQAKALTNPATPLTPAAAVAVSGEETKPKAAKGFYNKDALDEELCPVEEECEL